MGWTDEAWVGWWVVQELAADLRRRREESLERLARYGCEEIAAGEAEGVFRELEAVTRCLGLLPAVEAQAARAAAVARSMGLLLLAESLDGELPGNGVTERIRAEAAGWEK